MIATALPYVLHKDEGPATWTMDLLVRLKASTEQTGGVFALVDEYCPPGYATPLHVHHAEDEAFYLLEGEMTIFCGDQRIEAKPGSYVFGPREIPHGFRVEGAVPARVLILTVPAGLDQFLIETGEPARALTLPPPQPLDLDRMNEIAKRYQIELLGPLPA